MTSKKRPLGAHNPMVADLLHTRQGVRSPEPICITGFNYSEGHQMAHNKAHRGSNHNEICRQAYLLQLPWKVDVDCLFFMSLKIKS